MLSPTTITVTVAPLMMSGPFVDALGASKTFRPTYPAMNAAIFSGGMPTRTIGS